MQPPSPEPIAALRRRSLLLSLLPTPLAAAPPPAPPTPQTQTLRYLPMSARELQLDSYPLSLLELALRRAGFPAELQPSPVAMPQGRALLELERGQHLDVAWSMSSREREARLLPVRICLYRGLGGWRIPLVREADLFKDVHTPAQLGRFTAAQGHDWPDIDILRSNGLAVERATVGDGYFRLLAMGRVDYFPLEVSAVYAVADGATGLQIQVDPHLLLHYPSAFYFFVSKRRPELAAALERGLELALDDGSFQRLFMLHFRATLLRARLPERRLLSLHNPLLPEATPLARKKLWFSPEELKG